MGECILTCEDLGSKWCLSDLKHFVRINHSLRTGKMRESDLSVEELLICIQASFPLIKNVNTYFSFHKSAQSSWHGLSPFYFYYKFPALERP
jgi:hypothetical protein